MIWKGAFGAARFKPEEGMEVIAQGKITTFPGSSKYQIVIESLEPAGAGALMALLEERKRKFAAEGLFDEARKKPRPFLPKVVGIVTSPTGAVIRDMLHGFNERYPARVFSGRCACKARAARPKSPPRSVASTRSKPGGKIPRPDVLIVARGGGSLEDLWSFNEEIVVRAAAESRIPLISAVGHETDWTLIDLVADARAPTPTKAAEWAVPKYSELIDAARKADAAQADSGSPLAGGCENALEGIVARPAEAAGSRRAAAPAFRRGRSPALACASRQYARTCNPVGARQRTSVSGPDTPETFQLRRAASDTRTARRPRSSQPRGGQSQGS